MYFEDITDFVRNGFPYFLVLFLLSAPTLADSNFNIQRMVQYDINQVSYGCKAKTTINMEAKSLGGSFNFRNAIIARFQDMTIDQFLDAKNKAGGLIVLLPKTLHNLSKDTLENFLLLEKAMMSEDIAIPVYFAKFDEDIDRIIQEISRSPDGPKKTSALSEIFDKVSANGYQVSVSGASHTAKKDSKIPIVQGELIPFKQSASAKTSEDGSPHKLPVIIITTQLKTFGITNDLPPNYDTTVLLTLIDMFSKLYNHQQSSPKYRLIFVLHESGSLLNFQGAKKWLDTNTEDANIQNAEFALCLDSIADSLDSILMHVSKPPKEGSATFKFFEILKKKAELYGGKTTEGLHKKINLAEAFHKWEHERYSIKRISSFTLSSLRSYTDPIRTSIFSQHSPTSAVLEPESELDDVILENIKTNTKILAETLASYIFNNIEADDNQEIFTGPLSLTTKSIKPYIAPRSMSKSQNIKMTFDKFLKNVKVTNDKPDQREPEFMLYEGDDAKLNVYNVKPAVFDLFLTSLISCYLFGAYFIIIHFPKIYGAICKLQPAPTTNGVHHKNN